MERLVAQAEDMAEQGVKELILVAQETTVYGKDLYGKKSLHILLKKLCEIRGIRWIRVLYCYPEEIYDELIETIRDEKKICHYLDIPIQHASDRILKRMGRRTSKQELIDIIGKLRKEIPDMAITTDIIVGFPGETKEDVDETIDVIRRVKYDNAFTFIYSKRTGTPAAAMEQVPEELVKEQFDRVLKTVQETAREQVSRYQGQTCDVLVEEINENDSSLVTGRMSNNTLVHFPGDISLVGKLVNVSLDECHGFYYMGHMV